MPEPSTTPAPAARPPRKILLSALIFSAVALVGVLLVLYAWRLPPFRSALQSTENALVRGQVTIISPQLSGYVVEVLVQDFQPVRRGELLMRIDDRIPSQRLAQARAELANRRAALENDAQTRGSARAGIEQGRAALAASEAQARKAQADLRRVEELAADGSLSARERDQARAAQAQALAARDQARAALEIARQNQRSVDVGRGSLEAAVAGAEAAVKLAEIDLANTRITAPRDGQLGQVTVRQGAFVNAGAQLTALVPNQLWVIANMKETQMADVRLGQPVSFTVDALNDARLHGHVERISPATGSEFAVIAPDNATGNFVKVVQRVPVKIVLDGSQDADHILRPGMSVTPTVHTK